METRVRMGFKPTTKGIVTPDVTVDCTLGENETSKDVTKALTSAVNDFKEAVTELGYTNHTVEK